MGDRGRVQLLEGTGASDARTAGDASPEVVSREQLIIDHRWIAERCARRFARRGEPLDDLLQVAALGLVKAADRFDPTMGYSFPTFAMPTVLGELRRHFRDRTWAMHVPRRSKDLISRMNAATEALHQRYQRMPSADEVAEELGVDVEMVLETMEARRAYRPESLHVNDVDGDGGGLAHIDTVGADDHGLVAAADRVTTMAALKSLDARSRCIVLWRFYEGCTQAEIGERLGIGQVQVSRLLRAALGQMREILDSDTESNDVLDPGADRAR